MATDLKKLEYLSLLSKVCSELQTHLGFADKVLAEYIIELCVTSTSVDQFDSKLKVNGAELPDYLVRSLITVIHAIRPPKSDMELTTGGDANRIGKAESDVYKGRVSRVMDKGCFVELDGFKGKEGLVHSSDFVCGNKKNVKCGEKVYVNIVFASPGRNMLRLSMKDVDQNSGCDLGFIKKRKKITNDDNRTRIKAKRMTSVSEIKGTVQQEVDGFSSKGRMNCLDKFELNQLIASDALDVGDYPINDGQNEDSDMLESMP